MTVLTANRKTHQVARKSLRRSRGRHLLDYCIKMTRENMHGVTLTIFSGDEPITKLCVHPICVTVERRDPSLQIVPESDRFYVSLGLCKARSPHNQCGSSTTKPEPPTCQASLALISSFSPIGPILLRLPSSPWMNSRYAMGYT